MSEDRLGLRLAGVLVAGVLGFAATQALGATGATLAELEALGIVPVAADAGSSIHAPGASPDGFFVAGSIVRPIPALVNDRQAVLWVDGVEVLLPDLIEGDSTRAVDVSADGRVVVGHGRFSAVEWRKQTGVRWVDGGIERLPLLPDGDHSTVLYVSEDGSIILGTIYFGDESFVQVRWRNGVVEELPAAPVEVALVRPIWMSASGEVVVVFDGLLGPSARLGPQGWSLIEELPGGASRPRARAGTEDGSIVTGTGEVGAPTEECRPSNTCPDAYSAFIWTEAGGTRPLKEFLVYGCGYPLEAWTIGTAWVSRDGSEVIFSGTAPHIDPIYVSAPIADCEFVYPEPDASPRPGSLFVSSSNQRTVYHIDPKGYVRLLASHGALHQAKELEIGPGRVLYVLSGVGARRVSRVEIDTGAASIVTERDLIHEPRGLAVDRRGVPHVLDSIGIGGSQLLRVDPETGAQTQVAAWEWSASGLEREPGGTLAVLLQSSGVTQIHRYDPESTLSELVWTGTNEGKLGGLAVEPTGGWFIGFDWDSFLRIEPGSDTPTRIFVTPRHGVPIQERDRSGDLLFWELPAHYLLRVDPVTGESERGFGTGSFRDARYTAMLRAECGDGFDNDGDGLFDHPQDRSCFGRDDDSERFRGDVAIDVQPERDENRIVFPAAAPIKVAILGGQTFDPRTVDEETLAFGPAGAAPRRGRAQHRDVDGDGFRDATFSFDVAATGIGYGATEACLEGEAEGEAFRACDAIAVEQPGGCGRGFGLAAAAPCLLWLVRRRVRSRTALAG